MAIFARISFLSIVAATGVNTSVCAQSAGIEFTTAGGDTLVLSPIDEMECGDMDRMLERIDSTRYRENAPTPHNEADGPLFEYELTLAAENFTRCVVVQKNVAGGMLIMRRAASE